MNEEQWLPIPIDDRYEISSHGRIRRILEKYSSKGKILKQKISHGHPAISNLGPNGTTKRICVLVAMCFLSPKPPKSSVKHKDGNPLNNCLDNLEWGPRRDYSNNSSKLSEHQVWIIRNSKEKSAELAKRFNVWPQTIDNVRSGRTWAELVDDNFALRQTRFGFKWGPLEVMRMTDHPKHGVVISLMTEYEEMEVRCTPKGKRITAITHARRTPPSEPGVIIPFTLG